MLPQGTWIELSVEVDHEAVEAGRRALFALWLQRRRRHRGAVHAGSRRRQRTSRHLPTVSNSNLHPAGNVRRPLRSTPFATALWHLGQLRGTGELTVEHAKRRRLGQRLESALQAGSRRNARCGAAAVAGVRPNRRRCRRLARSRYGIWNRHPSDHADRVATARNAGSRRSDRFRYRHWVRDSSPSLPPNSAQPRSMASISTRFRFGRRRRISI